MKDTWSEQHDSTDFSSGYAETESVKTHRPTLLSGLSRPPDRRAIISSLPDKATIDLLVLHFFDAYTPLAPAKC